MLTIPSIMILWIIETKLKSENTMKNIAETQVSTLTTRSEALKAANDNAVNIVKKMDRTIYTYVDGSSLIILKSCGHFFAAK